ncbi:uncharacterized, partial [Tachysurus ichikawai]
MLLMTETQWDAVLWVTCRGQWASHYLSMVFERRRCQMIHPQRAKEKKTEPWGVFMLGEMLQHRSVVPCWLCRDTASPQAEKRKAKTL